MRKDAWAALALVTLALPVWSAGELRTLFHTAEERARLDRQRRGEPPEAAPAAKRGPAVVGGFVKRSDGRDTVWIDGRPVTMSGAKSAEYTDPAKVGRSGSPPIEIKRTR
jgi:hypothetical protein